jgi:hypothetical protein
MIIDRVKESETRLKRKRKSVRWWRKNKKLAQCDLMDQKRKLQIEKNMV